jgi:hypothetical protein
MGQMQQHTLAHATTIIAIIATIAPVAFFFSHWHQLQHQQPANTARRTIQRARAIAAVAAVIVVSSPYPYP